MNNEEFLQKNIEIKFFDQKLLQQVLTHRSYLNEHPKLKIEHNERLEFLGDAVLELVTTEFLYKKYQNPEGELTNWRSALVKGKMLAQIAQKFKIGKYLYLSRGEEKGGGRENQLLLANAFEALIGAIYLEKGYQETQKFIQKKLLSKLPEIIKHNLYIDPKSRFQELTQEEVGITPTYEVLSESGPDHAKIFEVGVFLGNADLGKGRGSSKQLAQTEAAKNALKLWDKNREKIFSKVLNNKKTNYNLKNKLL